MGNLIKTSLFVIAIFIVIFNLSLWQKYHIFKNNFHFSQYETTLKLDDAIHNDINIPITLIRFYHNKIVFYSIDFFDKQIQFLDIVFLNNFISITGIAGVIFGIIFLAQTKKTIYLWTILTVLLIINLIEIYFNPKISFLLKINFLAFPYLLLSILGYFFLLKKQKTKQAVFFVLIVFILTVYWQIFFLAQELTNYCM